MPIAPDPRWLAGRGVVALAFAFGCQSIGVGDGHSSFERNVALDRRTVEASSQTAVQSWRMQAERGDALAQSRIALMYELGRGVPRNYSEAARWYRAAGEQGDCGGQFHLGLLYLRGRGVPKDLDQAGYWMRLASDHETGSAELSFASLYVDPAGIPYDFAEASDWFQRTAKAGAAAGQYGLALLLRQRGDDPAESLEWIVQAAAQGHREAQFELARAYDLGEGVAEDGAEAARWYRAAAEAGLPEAQRGLGRALRDGRGLDPDPIRAYAWLSLAAAGGDSGAREDLALLEPTLARDQVLEAQARALALALAVTRGREQARRGAAP